MGVWVGYECVGCVRCGRVGVHQVVLVGYLRRRSVVVLVLVHVCACVWAPCVQAV